MVANDDDDDDDDDNDNILLKYRVQAYNDETISIVSCFVFLDGCLIILRKRMDEQNIFNIVVIIVKRRLNVRWSQKSVYRCVDGMPSGHSLP